MKSKKTKNGKKVKKHNVSKPKGPSKPRGPSKTKRLRKDKQNKGALGFSFLKRAAKKPDLSKLVKLLEDSHKGLMDVAKQKVIKADSIVKAAEGIFESYKHKLMNQSGGDEPSNESILEVAMVEYAHFMDEEKYEAIKWFANDRGIRTPRRNDMELFLQQNTDSIWFVRNRLDFCFNIVINNSRIGDLEDPFSDDVKELVRSSFEASMITFKKSEELVREAKDNGLNWEQFLCSQQAEEQEGTERDITENNALAVAWWGYKGMNDKEKLEADSGVGWTPNCSPEASRRLALPGNYMKPGISPIVDSLPLKTERGKRRIQKPRRRKRSKTFIPKLPRTRRIQKPRRGERSKTFIPKLPRTRRIQKPRRRTQNGRSSSRSTKQRPIKKLTQSGIYEDFILGNRSKPRPRLGEEITEESYYIDLDPEIQKNIDKLFKRKKVDKRYLNDVYEYLYTIKDDSKMDEVKPLMRGVNRARDRMAKKTGNDTLESIRDGEGWKDLDG